MDGEEGLGATKQQREISVGEAGASQVQAVVQAGTHPEGVEARPTG